MSIRAAGVTAAVAALVAVAAPLSAQRGLIPLESPNTSVVQFTPYAGYMSYGDFYRPWSGTSLSPQGGALYGAQVGFALVPNVALYGNAAYGKTNLQVGAPTIGVLDAGSSSMWLFDGGLQFTFPGAGWEPAPVRPFLQVGAGAMRYDLDGPDVTNTSATNFEWNVGAGIDARLTRGVGLRLMAKDYVGRFNYRNLTGYPMDGPTTQNWAFTAGLRLGF